MIDLLLTFLRQGGGRFSRRALGREVAGLTEDEAARLEALYASLTGTG